MEYNIKITKLKWIPFPKAEKAEALHNPYCGFYSIYRFYADSEMETGAGIPIEEIPNDPLQPLILVEINLLHFNESELSKEALYMVHRIFSHFSSAGKQMIVRFLYDWEGKGILSEPKDINIILNHMSQLSGLLKEYTEYIYILQGLFIGSWGEMHSSRYLSERHMTRLARQLYECSGEKTQIALRCPNFWRMIFKTNRPLDRESAFTNIQKARFSLFNDGIMASETDFGTYGSMGIKDSVSYADKWVRKDELEFQNQLCKYVSNGGEVINECSFNDAGPAIEGLKKMMVSYLHSEYDEKVLDKWKNAKMNAGNALWKDKTAYEYIEAHLGYRFTLEDASLSLAPDKSGGIKAAARIVNHGFAPCYHKFTVKFIIRSADFSEIYEYEADTDTRMWMPDERIGVQALIPPFEIGKKSYILCLGIYDSRMCVPIRIANTFSAPDHMGYYKLGSFIAGIT